MKTLYVICIIILSVNLNAQELKQLDRGNSSISTTSLEKLPYVKKLKIGCNKSYVNRNLVVSENRNYRHYNYPSTTEIIANGVLSEAKYYLLRNNRYFTNYSFNRWWYPRPRLYNSSDYLRGYWGSQFNFRRGINGHF